MSATSVSRRSAKAGIKYLVRVGTVPPRRGMHTEQERRAEKGLDQMMSQRRWGSIPSHPHRSGKKKSLTTSSVGDDMRQGSSVMMLQMRATLLEEKMAISGDVENGYTLRAGYLILRDDR